MTRIDARIDPPDPGPAHDRIVSDGLHPLIYKALAGLALWLSQGPATPPVRARLSWRRRNDQRMRQTFGPAIMAWVQRHVRLRCASLIKRS